MSVFRDLVHYGVRLFFYAFAQKQTNCKQSKKTESCPFCPFHTNYNEYTGKDGETWNTTHSMTAPNGSASGARSLNAITTNATTAARADGTHAP